MSLTERIESARGSTLAPSNRHESAPETSAAARLRDPFAKVKAKLLQRGLYVGKQLVIVRYSANHNPQDEWVYNAAGIDDSRVVWARELDPASNLNLIHYYRDRKPWLVEPDAATPVALPYPIPEPPPSHDFRAGAQPRRRLRRAE